MYTQFYGFHEQPFSITPDTQFFFDQSSHRDALNTLKLALDHGEGFIKVVGEVGTGKTLLCRILLSRLDKQRYVTAYIPNPWLTPQELKAFVAQEIGATYQSTMPAHEITAALYRKLVQIARHKKQVVLIVDEAQAMPRETLEALRLLTNLETEKQKLLQVVVLGQPELDVLLNRKDLRQLKQRIVFSEYLKPFNLRGLKTYINHRLLASGYERGGLFSNGACWLLLLASGGIPRMINILAHKALLCAYGRGHHQINAWHIGRAVLDTPESRWGAKLTAFVWRFNARLTAANMAGVQQ